MLRLRHGATTRSFVLQSSVQVAAARTKSTNSKESGDQRSSGNRVEQNAEQTGKQQQRPKKTLAQMDEDMRRAMEGLAGDGGEAGLELEDGKAVSMKRGVRENMFRYI
jgi:hypothetical protein